MKKIFSIFEFIIIGFIIFALHKKNSKIEHLEKSVQKYFNMYETVYQWINVKLDQEKVESFFEDQEFDKVAIYGMGDLGNLFLREFQKSEKIKIICGIDRNAGAIISEIPIFKPESIETELDVVVVTIVDEFESIKISLSQHTNAKIISIEDVLYNL